MKILIANPGSTSYKCKLYQTEDMTVLFQGAIDRIGDEQGTYRYAFDSGQNGEENLHIADYEQAVRHTMDTITEKFAVTEIDAVGFKTVHAKGVSGCVELNGDVLQAMEEYRPLAPVHTDVYLTAITIFKKVLKSTPLIGLFETHFHTSIPPEAYLYGIPYELYQKYGIRKYGFHGASHRYIGQKAKELYNSHRTISCHLGGSASVCAIRDGRSLDVSMGMSPQSGLLNAKRVGDLDVYGLLYLMEKENLSIAQTRDLLMSKGGVYGISGRSGDLRDVENGMAEGREQDRLAFKTFAYYVRRYIGEYLAVLNGVDCIVFTAGAGENSPALRKEIVGDMDRLNILLDEEANQRTLGEGLISRPDSGVKIAVIHTNEEYIVAKEVEGLLLKRQKQS